LFHTHSLSNVRATFCVSKKKAFAKIGDGLY